ncbi:MULTISPECIES: low molecular weight protein-tyrosine-phosphatase [Bacillota]|jgi:protein-tyrosine phosphatase|uniref:protein-tyrosine-phosphatase n=2 Tax=Amedibacillus TaxID=2749846 RepID=A0A7G9GPK2_9FIRM|nr:MULTISPECIES: low molecular weight protein-tyrosine-phosphatase [Bacillota]QNM12734.1 low molecular weight phosphotyrosine protein phosphatase [[Eubacterium] hominis]MCH4287664.1 low molecular weight phosphotyrosine protein phosphatase [Amedibacillus hominis]RGB52658.1 low molecular weight phosphotyrosine protein phosphatase [Absiella sp. AM10-20]RGB58305.1 low molecular weight phosphotyrosine protein phosphatase [Absiella sp. AM22-9]RGB63005.1 low molecular weight phosphotyrosine protein p
MIKILFICHGNICRSPMAQFVLEDMVEKAGMRDQFMIDSCATSREEIGNGVHYGTKDKLRKEGVRMHDHRARQLTKKDYEEYDYLIGMEETNIRNMKHLLGGDPEHKMMRLLDFSDHPRDIVDPWYTDNFDITYTDIVEGCEAFLKTLKK